MGEQLGRLASSLLGGSLLEIHLDLWGVEEEVRIPATVAAVKGALTPFLGEAVNFVNAENIAAGRGIEIVRSTHHQSGEYPHLVAVTLKGEAGEVSVAGTVFAESDPRVVRLEGYRLEFRPKGFLLVLRNKDVPGVVGQIGTLLGEAAVNIAEIHLARSPEGEEAMAVVRLDGELQPQVLEAVRGIPEVTEVTMIELGGLS